MTIIEKYIAMQDLVGNFNLSIKLDTNKNWYVAASGREICDNGILKSNCGRGKTPEEAIENDWQIYTQPNLVIRIANPTPEHYTWSGYMWKKLRTYEAKLLAGAL